MAPSKATRSDRKDRDQNSETFNALHDLIAESKRMHTKTTQDLENVKQEIMASVAELDSKASLHGFRVEEILKSLGRLEPVNPDTLLELMSRMQKLSLALDRIQIEAKSASRQQEFLKALYFKLIKMRESKILDAHAQTFEWIFSEDNPDPAFLNWLQHDSGIFYIMGKAGSGKSTLMKFLVNRPETPHSLRKWAKGNSLVLAPYYFWSAGHPLQKSLEGLFRTLLFEILRKCPQMIEDLTPHLGESYIASDDSTIWSIQELLHAFEYLGKQSQLSASFCFFIDGLDEFDGEKPDLIKALRLLAKIPNIKMCVSSRPEFVFKDEYGRCDSTMLKLEDLTHNDISTFVKDTLEDHELFDSLRAEDPRYEALVEQIVTKAEGVFLWVFLVVQSLLRGLTNADDMTDLQARIDLLPPSLQEFFGHMLGSVEEVYRKDTYKAFQYVLKAPPSGPIPLIVFSYLDERNSRYGLDCPDRLLSDTQRSKREENMRRRLDGRTKGLLEASATSDGIATVDFLHRTARDFLLTAGMQRMLKENLDATFDADRKLAVAFLAQMKLGPKPSSRFEHAMADPFTNMLWYAHELEEKNAKPETELIDHAREVVMHPSSPWICTVQDEGGFVGCLVRNNLKWSVSKILEVPSKLQTKSNTALLQVCLSNVSKRQDPHQYLSPEMAKLLLSNGANPNQNLSFSATIWTDFLSTVAGHPIRDRGALLDVLALLIAKGADLDVPIQVGTLNRASLNSTSFMEASDLIRKIFPRDWDWLMARSPSRATWSTTLWSFLRFK